MGLADGEAWEKENPPTSEDTALVTLEFAYRDAAAAEARCRVDLARANKAQTTALEAHRKAAKTSREALEALLKVTEPKVMR